MRARNIKPGFYKNEELIECSIWARHLAPGLWMMADKEGRLEDRPKQIKIEIFPCDNVDVNQLLDELAAHQHIQRYEVGGKRFIQICKFSDHQRPHNNEADSLIPSPDGEISKGKDKKLSSKVESPPNKEESASSLTTDSPFLIPESIKQEVRAAKKLRGTRLPPDWELSDEEGEWAIKEFNLTVDEIIMEAEKFKDYWHARAGPGGVKLDWQATWRNWIRKVVEGKNYEVQRQKKYR